MKQISYLEDIVEETHGKLNQKTYSKELIKDLMETYFDYIVEESKTGDCHSFEIPYLGTLYRSAPLLRNSKYKYNKKSQERKEIESTLEELKYFTQEINKNSPHKRLPISFSYYSILKKDWEIAPPYTLDKQSLEILSVTEAIQNKANKPINEK